jgi:hypothetical protein
MLVACADGFTVRHRGAGQQFADTVGLDVVALALCPSHVVSGVGVALLGLDLGRPVRHVVGVGPVDVQAAAVADLGEVVGRVVGGRQRLVDTVVGDAVTHLTEQRRERVEDLTFGVGGTDPVEEPLSSRELLDIQLRVGGDTLGTGVLVDDDLPGGAV